jgi:hypothetical protein
MDAKRFVKFCHDRSGQPPDLLTYTLDPDRPNLLSLRLGVVTESRLIGPQENLKRVDAGDVRGDRDHRYHTPPEPGRGRIGGIVTDNNGRAGLAGFGSACRFQVDGHDVAATQLLFQAVGGHGIPGGSLCFVLPGRERLFVCVGEVAHP